MGLHAVSILPGPGSRPRDTIQKIPNAEGNLKRGLTTASGNSDLHSRKSTNLRRGRPTATGSASHELEPPTGRGAVPWILLFAVEWLCC